MHILLSPGLFLVVILSFFFFVLDVLLTLAYTILSSIIVVISAFFRVFKALSAGAYFLDYTLFINLIKRPLMILVL